jgi:hypothetical protein
VDAAFRGGPDKVSAEIDFDAAAAMTTNVALAHPAESRRRAPPYAFSAKSRIGRTQVLRFPFGLRAMAFISCKVG